MHEMGIAMQIIEIATASLPAGMENVKIERVNLKIGKLSAVVPESLRFCFEIAAQDTPLGDAKLQIEEVPVIVKCNDCHTQHVINEAVFRCRKCNSGSVDIISGRELDIDSIEIADEDAQDADNIV
uniref:Hydrogenase maturation factor HypA n=1 Tax=Candidatus Desulfatibia profunda TaxID=2841695 RepID=A0A8J6NWP9_9BACT|nr:hydrogenase maturation nickel metallochaperone HypA [Candidatus Desulfatibia profunda]